MDEQQINTISSKTLSKSAPKLKDLKIIFENGPNSGPLDKYRGEPKLNDWKMEKLRGLQNLKLHLPRVAFVSLKTENEGKFDLSALKRMKRLKSLDLAMVKPGPDCKKFIFEPPKGRLLPNLKRFQWNISDFRWVEFEGFQELGSELQRSFRIPSEKFSLKLQKNGLMEADAINTLNQSFANLKTDVNQLQLAIFSDRLNNKSSDVLISALSGPKLKRIETLYLEFWKWEGINDKFVAKLGQILSPKLKYLRLSLEFYSEASGIFVYPMKTIYGGEDTITDKGVSQLGESLSERCGDLEFVWLEFWKYGKISDKGVESLCESLGKIESLKRVRLRFKECCEVSEVGRQYAKEKLGPKREVQFALV